MHRFEEALAFLQGEGAVENIFLREVLLSCGNQRYKDYHDSARW